MHPSELEWLGRREVRLRMRRRDIVQDRSDLRDYPFRRFQDGYSPERVESEELRRALGPAR